jgi:SRSO17 transposase
VAADSVYGVGDIETALKRAAKGYGLGVNANPSARSWGKALAANGTAKDIPEALPGNAWPRLSAGEGTKGARRHDWTISISLILTPMISTRLSPASGPAGC